MGILKKLFGGGKSARPEPDSSSISSYTLDYEGMMYVAGQAVEMTLALGEKVAALGYEIQCAGYPYVCASMLYALVRYHDFDLENENTLYFVNSMILLANHQLEERAGNDGFPIDKLSMLMDMSDELALQVPQDFRVFLTATCLIAVNICNFLIKNGSCQSIPQDILSVVNDTFRLLIRQTLNRAGFPEDDEMAAEPTDGNAIAGVLHNLMQDSRQYVASLLSNKPAFSSTYNRTMCGFYCACMAAFLDLDASFLAEQTEAINRMLEPEQSAPLSEEICTSILNSLTTGTDAADAEAFLNTAGTLFAEYALAEVANRELRTRRSELTQFGIVSVRNFMDYIEQLT